jgi:hypothetical protein
MSELSDDERNLLRYYAATERIIHGPVRGAVHQHLLLKATLKNGESIPGARRSWSPRPVGKPCATGHKPRAAKTGLAGRSRLPRVSARSASRS